jgi:prefoldin subunit 5
MDEVDRLLRQLEEVAEEIQALRFRLSYLEDQRVELRESIKQRSLLPNKL